MASNGGGDAGGSEITLEHTPTWIVTVVCSFIVLVSYLFERLLHQLGKYLRNKNYKALSEALQKVKEELMLLGFISLLLMVFQGAVQSICLKESLMNHFLPCKNTDNVNALAGASSTGRRLLSSGDPSPDHCQQRGLVPLLSAHAVEHLHTFIFALAVTHVLSSATTVVLGLTQINRWKRWEDAVVTRCNTTHKMINEVQQFKFIKDHYKGLGMASESRRWLHSFVKQFYETISREDYTTMRLGFIMKHSKGNPKFNFYSYMVRALEADFKKVVGLSWYLWIFVMIFLLLNIDGWYSYFWISLVPLLLLLITGTKLEYIITDLAHEVAEKNTAVEGCLIVNPSDELFWFRRPKIILHLIHFILFQSAFEIAYFFWILGTFGFNSCMMGKAGFSIPRLVISIAVQVFCSYSTLPLYAIVTHMGSSFKSAIFDDHITEGLLNWAKNAKKRKGKSSSTSFIEATVVVGNNAYEINSEGETSNRNEPLATELS